MPNDVDWPASIVCVAGAGPMAAGAYAFVGMSHDEEVPLEDSGHSYIYSAVFDSDGDPANDWQWVSPWDFDLFQDTDRWYQLI